MKQYALNILIGLDQFMCTWFGGFPDESMSSYLWRLDNKGKPAGRIIRPAVDYIALKVFGQAQHCLLSYQAERARAQFPPELR